MSEISISEIPVSDIQNLKQGLSPTIQTSQNTITYHVYSPPYFQHNPNTLLDKFGLDKTKYYLNYQNSNRGTKTGRPNKCKNCKTPIEVNNKMIRLTEKSEIEYHYGQDSGIRPIFKSWLFGNEECLISWLNENNPSEII